MPLIIKKISSILFLCSYKNTSGPNSRNRLLAGRTLEKIEEEVNKDFQEACDFYTPVIDKIDQGKIQDKPIKQPGLDLAADLGLDLAADLKKNGVQTK